MPPKEGQNRKPSVQRDDLKVILNHADLTADDCGHGREGHPSLAMSHLLDRIYDPAVKVTTPPCNQCGTPPPFHPGFYRDQAAVREILPDGRGIIYLLHPDFTAELRELVHNPHYGNADLT